MLAFSQRSPNERLMTRVELENPPTFLTVVAAAIRDAEGRLLLQKALPNKRHAGLWEFPGGKLENGETPRDSLCREIAEELGLELVAEAMTPAGFAEESASVGDSGIVLLLYNCPSWRGEPEGRDGQRWGWFDAAEADRLPLAGMDRVLLRALGG